MSLRLCASVPSTGVTCFVCCLRTAKNARCCVPQLYRGVCCFFDFVEKTTNPTRMGSVREPGSLTHPQVTPIETSGLYVKLPGCPAARLPVILHSPFCILHSLPSAPCLKRDQPPPRTAADRFRAVGRAEFGIDGGDVEFDRVLADAQAIGDELVG